MKHGGSLRPVQSGQLQEVSAPTRTEDRYRGRILANVVNDKGAPQRVLDVLRSDSVAVRRADNQTCPMYYETRRGSPCDALGHQPTLERFEARASWVYHRTPAGGPAQGAGRPYLRD